MIRRQAGIKRILGLLGFVVICLTILQCWSQGTSRFHPRISNSQARRLSLDSMIKRNIHKACSSLGYPKAESYVNATSQVYTVNRYNLAICIVPKAGCSFLKQVVYFLNDPRALVPNQWKDDREGSFKMYWKSLSNITKTRENIFTLPRENVHFDVNFSPIYISTNVFSHRSSHYKVIVSRNPYTRLYSSYIDKIYVPALLRHMYRSLNSADPTRNTDKSGSKDVCDLKTESFEGFLQKIVDLANKHKISNQHWLSVTNHCNPCEAMPDFIIHQESYSDDIRTLLKTVNVTSEEQATIQSAMATDVVQTKVTLRGLIITMYNKGMEGSKKCFTEMEIARRVWGALKFQGQIHYFLKFPEEKLTARKEIKPETVAKVFLEKIKEMPISVKQAKFQRNKFLVQAYKNVPANVLKDIQALYHYDFLIFGYDKTPPS